MHLASLSVKPRDRYRLHAHGTGNDYGVICNGKFAFYCEESIEPPTHRDRPDENKEAFLDNPSLWRGRNVCKYI